MVLVFLSVMFVAAWKKTKNKKRFTEQKEPKPTVMLAVRVNYKIKRLMVLNIASLTLSPPSSKDLFLLLYIPLNIFENFVFDLVNNFKLITCFIRMFSA